jgi:peptide/nickel transport system substrate-binding protein
MKRRTFLLGGAAAIGGGYLLLAGEQAPPAKDYAKALDIQKLRDTRPEGGLLVENRARFPESLTEAPQLRELVQAGKLPNVRQRVGQDPIVIEPLHEIGRYGGTIRRGFVGGGDQQVAMRFASGPDNLLYWDYEWRKLIPNIARNFSVSENGRVLTIFLRRGMNWSDGVPFTADDILFWYEVLYLDRRIVAAPSSSMQIDGTDVLIARLDDFTVQFISAKPYFVLPEILAGHTDIGGQSLSGRSGLGGYCPAHYLQQFHPKYRSEEELLREARNAGFANWPVYLKNRNDWLQNTALPVITPWKTVSPINRQNMILERNPFSVWVDIAGNQLPYVDRVHHSLCAGPDVVNFKASTGAFDFQDRHLYISNLPYLLRNRKRSNYDIYLDPYEGTDLGVRFNLAYEEDAVIGTLLASRKFRRALSLGVDRRAINEVFMLGTGRTTASVPSPENRYYPGDQWSTRWARFDPDAANVMLDQLGMTKRDDDGFRLRPDGRGRIRISCHTIVAHFDYPAVGEMLRGQWKVLGIDLDIRVVEINLWIQLSAANAVQTAIQVTGSEDPYGYADFLFPSTNLYSGGVSGVPFVRWFQSNGKDGTRPPQYIVDMMTLWRKGRTAPDEERIELGKELIRLHVDNVVSIGLISNGVSFYAIRVVNRDLGNVPRRIVNTHMVKSPVNALPMTFYFKDR